MTICHAFKIYYLDNENYFLSFYGFSAFGYGVHLFKLFRNDSITDVNGIILCFNFGMVGIMLLSNFVLWATSNSSGYAPFLGRRVSTKR
jgi:hypothetical protein